MPHCTRPAAMVEFDAEATKPMEALVEFVLFKVCSECGQEKPRGKFYKHCGQPDGLMPHCKFCHNGGMELVARNRAASMQPQWGDPLPHQIAAACEEIRSRWSDSEKQKRRERPWFWRKHLATGAA